MTFERWISPLAATRRRFYDRWLLACTVAVAALLSGATASAAPGSACITIVDGVTGSSEDTSIASDLPNTNLGTMPNGLTGGNGSGAETRQLLNRFDLSAIPASASITSATLTVAHISYGGSAAVRAHRITAPWAEQTVTYASFNGAFDPTVAASATTSIGPVSFDITEMALRWMADPLQNYGVLLEQDSTARTSYRMRETPSASTRPRLDVCFVNNLSLCPAGLAVAGDVTIKTQSSVGTYGCVASIGRDLLVSSSAATDLTLPYLSTVSRRLTLSNNTALQSLSLPSLTFVGAELSINNNDALTNVDSLYSLTSIGTTSTDIYDGTLYVNGNASLTNLDGLVSLTTTGGGVWISGNDALTDLDGLSNLTTIDMNGNSEFAGWLYILNNDALTQVDGLGQITDVYTLNVGGNDALQSLGMTSLTNVMVDATVTNNPVLPQCLLDALFANVTYLGLTTYGNDVTAVCP